MVVPKCTSVNRGDVEVLVTFTYSEEEKEDKVKGRFRWSVVM